jgi:hypothetical protein
MSLGSSGEIREEPQKAVNLSRILERPLDNTQSSHTRFHSNMVEDLDSNSIATRTVPDKSATIIFQKMLSLTGTEGGENTGKGFLEKVDQLKLSSMERDELEMYY